VIHPRWGSAEITLYARSDDWPELLRNRARRFALLGLHPLKNYLLSPVRPINALYLNSKTKWVRERERVATLIQNIPSWREINPVFLNIDLDNALSAC
jgi:hypothetical protein